MLARLVSLLLISVLLHAATLPEGGHNVLPADWQAAAKAQGSTKLLEDREG